MRFNMPFGSVGAGEFGTYFIGYARSPEVIEQMLTNMFIGKPPGNHDRILDFSTAVTGNLFFVPTVDFLDDPPARPSVARPVTSEAASGDGSLGIGSLKRSVAMNHLLRELAPITRRGLGAARRGSARAAGAGARSSQAGRLLRAARLGALGDEPGRVRRALAASPCEGVSGLQRRVLPLVELRADFELSRAELRDADRGADDGDSGALDNGRAPDRRRREHRRLPRLAGRDHRHQPRRRRTGHVARRGSRRISRGRWPRRRAAPRQSGVGGPYGMALGSEEYRRVIETAEHGGYPLLDHLAKILEGPLVWAPGVNGAVVLSLRGGDFVLRLRARTSRSATTRHDADAVRLYLEESFSFHVATPEAAVTLQP